MKEIGKFIRAKRKERRLRLEDLADDHISTATISNIERGVPHVNKDKVLYLLEKMNLNIKEVPELILKDSENMERIELTFTSIETLIEIGKGERALGILQRLSDRPLSNYQAMKHLLKGRIFSSQKEWKKAEREFSDAIRLANLDSYAKKMNVEASSYYAFALCRYAQNDIEQALVYVKRGIESFQEDDETDNQLIYHLLLKQVIYMEQLGHTNDAIKKLNQLWESIELIQKNEIILEMYCLRADLFRRMKLYHDAIDYARKGIDLAIGTRHHEELFKLWVMLARTYIEIEQLERAETCLEFVQEMVGQVQCSPYAVLAYFLITQLHLIQNRLDEAAQTGKEGMLLVGIAEDDELKNRMKLLCAQVEKKKQRWNEAVILCKQVIEDAQAKGFMHICFEGYFVLADCYRLLQDDEQFLHVTKRMYELQKKLRLHTTESIGYLGS